MTVGRDFSGIPGEDRLEQIDPVAAGVPTRPVSPSPHEAPGTHHEPIDLSGTPRSQWYLFRRRFLRHRLAITSIFVLLLLILMCFGAGLLQRFTPFVAPAGKQNLELGAVGPSGSHWFGTDQLGRDYFSEMLYAGRTSLLIGLVVAFLSTVIGTAIGAVAGYFGGIADQILMRLTDLFLVLPSLIVLALALRYFGGSVVVIELVLAALFWMGLARIVRSQVRSIKEKEFIEAARAGGASARQIIVKHVLPNCIGPIVVAATLAVVQAILVESALSYLGYGVKPPATSWGSMLADSKGYFGTDQAYLIWFPGLAILLTVLCVNFIGDGLRDAFDPKSRL
jgi:peptide/nickel transport system permease protein